MRPALYAAAGGLAGLMALPLLALWSPGIFGMLAIMALLAAMGVERGLDLAARAERRTWSAQRCWEILANDHEYDLDQQQLAAIQLADLGRGVVQSGGKNWWPWRPTAQQLAARLRGADAGWVNEPPTWRRGES